MFKQNLLSNELCDSCPCHYHFSRPHPVFLIFRHGEVSDCGRYLFVFPQKGCHGNLVYFCDLQKVGAIKGKLPLTQIVFEFEYDFQYITTAGTKAIFR